MRHKVVKNSFGRRPGPRKALIRGLVDALVEHGRIKTTLTKAKVIRGKVERAITKGKENTVHAKRVVLQKYPNPNTVETIFNDLSKRFKDRPGGYTRIIKLGARTGDSAPMAYIEFVDYNPADKKVVDVAAQKEVTAKKATTLRKRKRKIQEKSRIVNR
ncbi:MAG: 50S ribosomal protein L17 [Bdellovibrionaceae bacterium]|nr:50S ribosomal protein L17 [Pseudobdellovibrionaceae bacterium]